MGNFKKGSDIDLAVMNPTKPETILEISAVLNEEKTLPHLFDLVSYNTIAENNDSAYSRYRSLREKLCDFRT